MTNLEIASALGYACIFSSDYIDASDNLFRLISKKQCGYDEGADYWIKCINQLLDSDYDFKESNEMLNLTHSKDYWKQVLIRLKKLLAQ